MLCMAFSVGTVSVEAQHRDAAINKATEGALIKGLWSGCAELTNPTRGQLQAVIAEMEAQHSLPGEGGPPYGAGYWNQLKAMAKPMDCTAYSQHRSEYYTGP